MSLKDSNIVDNTANSKESDNKTLLDSISTPDDIKTFSIDKLNKLADEIRDYMIKTVSKTGGHLGAGLGVVELTIALHYIFNTPRDKIIWDVGHQSYPHKILTGRRKEMTTLRQEGGISGFCKREESIYDPFGAGHSSTSISAALGMAAARDLNGDKFETIAVIGDGAMSAGMAYEALNNAGALKKRLIVVLNDNEMSIAPAVGAMSAYLSRLLSSSPYQSFRDISKAVVSKFPDALAQVAKRAEAFARGLPTGGTLFEELGMYYIGPVDGHNLEHLLPLLANIRDMEDERPVLIHVVTKKGKGYAPAENSDDKYHGVSCFDPDTGLLKAKKQAKPSYTSVFAKTLIEEAKKNDKIVAITAAMPSGTGLDKFAKEFPERFFDVGIAEQHAVTFAAAMACEGIKPFVAIYSTFLQRAYGQIIHDVAIQNLPVKFAIDRAGLVGADGCTHAGLTDIGFLSSIPNMVVMAAGDEKDLQNMVITAANYDESPIAFRFPRGEILGEEAPQNGTALEIGKGRIVSEGDNKHAIINFGARLGACIRAAEELQEKHNISLTIVDARFAKPLDSELIIDIVKNHEKVIIIEEGFRGGFAAQVMHMLAENDLINNTAKHGKKLAAIKCLTVPDEYIPHAAQERCYEMAGLGTNHIVEAILAT